MITIFVCLSLLFGFCFYLKKRYGIDILAITLDRHIASWFLIFWIGIGFFLGLDYTETEGCMILSESIFLPKRVLFSTISLGLILASILVNRPSVKFGLCLLELIYWTLKLILFKGGYALGFGGDPLFSVVLYDFIGALIRLLILNKSLSIARNSLLIVIGLSYIIVSVKILCFPMSNYYEYKNSSEEFLKQIPKASQPPF